MNETLEVITKTLIIVFIIIFLSNFAFSTIINIPDDQPSIWERINVVVDGDTVLIQPGIYLYKIEVGKFKETKKIILIK